MSAYLDLDNVAKEFQNHLDGIMAVGHRTRDQLLSALQEHRKGVEALAGIDGIADLMNTVAGLWSAEVDIRGARDGGEPSICHLQVSSGNGHTTQQIPNYDARSLAPRLKPGRYRLVAFVVPIDEASE